MEHFSTFPIAMKIENVTDLNSQSNHCTGNKFFHHNYAVYPFKLFIISQIDEGYSKKIVAKMYLFPHC